MKVAFDLPDQAVQQALVLRQDSGLLDAINGALEELRADGTLAELGEKYFGEDVSGPGGGAESSPSGADASPSQSGN